MISRILPSSIKRVESCIHQMACSVSGAYEVCIKGCGFAQRIVDHTILPDKGKDENKTHTGVKQ